MLASPLALSDLPASSAQRRVVLGCTLGLIVAVIVLAPAAQLQLAELPAFAGLFAVVVAVADFLTCALLVTLGATRRSRSVRLLACAYLMSGAMAALHLFTFPGAITVEALLPVRRDTVAWLYIVWRCAFAAMVLAAVVVQYRDSLTAPAASPPYTMGRAAAITLGFVLLAFIVAAFAPLPPYLRPGDRFTSVTLLAAMVTGSISVLALVMIWATQRMRQVLYLWLSVVLIATTAGLALSVFGGGRYTLGWYGARVTGIAASTVVLGLLLVEFVRLHRLLMQTVDRLQAQTEALQIEVHRRERAEHMLVHAQKMKALGQLAGGVAHDFNNFLQVIGARTHLMQRRPAGAVADDFDVIRRTIKRAESLTRQLLSIAGRRSLAPRPLEPVRWMPEMMPLLRSLLRKEIELEVNVAPHTWSVHVDHGELETALVNLAANARDAMPDGGTLRIDVDNDIDEHGRWVVLRVADTGRGIDRAVLERVFEPFFTTKETGAGSGLGLSQVHGFADQSGGSVQVDSEPGQGTTVTLRLPSAAQGEAAADSDGDGGAASSRGEPWNARGALVLLVEDNEDVAESARALLQQLGFTVHRAANAPEALAYMASGAARPQFVVSDIRMPGGMSGIELARELRARYGPLAIVLCTGYSEAADQAQASGDVVLHKPYTLEELRSALAALQRANAAVGSANGGALSASSAPVG